MGHNLFVFTKPIWRSITHSEDPGKGRCIIYSGYIICCDIYGEMSLPAIIYQVINILLRLEIWLLMPPGCRMGVDVQRMTLPVLLLPGTGYTGLCPRVGSHVPLPHSPPTLSSVQWHHRSLLTESISHSHLCILCVWHIVDDNKSIKWTDSHLRIFRF